MVSFKIIVVFIDGIVGEMHTPITEVILGGADVFLQVERRLSGKARKTRRMVTLDLGAKTDKAIMVKVHPKRFARGHQDVQPQIELEVVDEEGLFDVVLRHHAFPRVHLVEALRQEDSPALTTRVGLGGTEQPTAEPAAVSGSD